MKPLLLVLLLILSSLSVANHQPFCGQKKLPATKVIAYLGADSNWDIEQEDLSKLEAQLQKVDVVNYSFIRLVHDAQGNMVPDLTAQDVKNIQTLRQLRPNLAIILAVGGWGDRESFTRFVGDKQKRAAFISAAKQILQTYQLDGIDVDWENELLASQEEISGVGHLIQELKQHLADNGLCVTSAVPGTSAYWLRYPDAKMWAKSVDWTTVMAYDNYGTFGMRSEHGAALYDLEHKADSHYPYPTTSVDLAVKHYFKQGVSADKIIMGIPFYCHSYFIKNSQIDAHSKSPGLHVPVIDPNINSQMSYHEAWQRYGEQLSAYQDHSGPEDGSITSYGLIPIAKTDVSRFMSCDNPTSVASKIAYVKGKNKLPGESRHPVKLGGVSFWSLQQDLPVENPNSLLKAIREVIKV